MDHGAFLPYRFRIRWNDEHVAAFTHVSGLTVQTEVVSFRADGQSQSARKIPGQREHEPVRLSRGITTDAGFQDWAGTLDGSRKEMQIEVYDEAGQLALRYNLHNCWPSEYTPLPELDSESNAVALASMTLQHEGWDRDPTLTPTTP